MLNITQIDFVKSELEKNGSITRNECLRNYISRLGAIIDVLKKQGWDFETRYIKSITPWGVGKDYEYKLIKKGLK